jgi:hypothetical protein
MVPGYQLFVDLAVAGALTLTPVFAPFIFGKPFPRWLEVGMIAIGLILFGGVGYALLNGHWPFRG